MRTIQFGQAAPEGALRLVGMLSGVVLEPIGVDESLLTAVGFTGEAGKVQLLVGTDGPVMLVGLGDEVDWDGLNSAVASAVRNAPAERELATSLHQIDLEGALSAVVLGAQLGSYRFDEYRSRPENDLQPLTLVGPSASDEFDRATTAARQVCQARDWVNRAPAEQAPEVLAVEMATRLEAVGFATEVWDEERIAAERLGGLAGVAKGSDRPPRLLVAHLNGETARPHLALVGKGIVFDSGGLSIKTAEGMQTMKCDMAGAATVVAAATAIGEMGIDLRVSVFVPLTDNMPGGSATKPGDVLTTRNGKTIEVLNTDAEGRLVLADGLSLASEQEPDLIVDVATLTGAARVALGDHIAALLTSSDEVADQVRSAAATAGERVWPMPLPEDYRKLIDSDVADMKNTGGRPAGVITAALLLAEFVDDHPWAHLDIAAPAWAYESRDDCPKGGTGFGVRTLIDLATAMSQAGPGASS